MAPGEAGSGQGGGGSTSGVQTPVFRSTSPPDGEEQMERVLRPIQAQEERLRKRDSAERKPAHKREAVPIPTELKAWRSDLKFLADTFIRAFPERWWGAQGLPCSHPCFCVPLWGGRRGGMACLFRCPHGGLCTPSTLVNCASFFSKCST